jgi:hypothetical protein
VKKYGVIWQNVQSCVLTGPSTEWTVVVATGGKTDGLISVSHNFTDTKKKMWNCTGLINCETCRNICFH